MTSKKILSCILVASMITGAIPVSMGASAADTPATVTITPDTTKDNLQNSGSMTITLKIKQDITPTVTLADWQYKGTPSTPEVTGNTGNGEVTYLYKAKGADDSTYSETVPTAQGSYTVKASIAETADYKAGEATADFEIKPYSTGLTITLKIKQSITPTVSLADWQYKGTPNTPEVTGNSGNGEVTYLYKAKDADDSTYSETVPTAQGSYTVKASIAETADYKAGEATADFEIKPYSTGLVITLKIKQSITPTVSLTGWTYGGTANTPSVTGNTGNGDVTYLYKLKTADDAAYSATVPTAAGEYTVKAVIAETDEYKAGEATADFTIAKATPTPEAPTNLTADYGKKLSDIRLPDGWAWNAPKTSVGNVGDNAFAATYTPADTDNYNTVQDNLTVKVVAVDKTSLNEAIAAANTYLATIKKTVYTDPALALDSAITDAKAVAENDNVTEAQVAQAITDVNKAVTTAKAAVKDIDDTKAAQAVTDKINALPAAEAIKSTDKEAVEAARAAYANLTEAQSAKVPKAATDKLTAAEKAVADRIAADAVIEKINAIGEVVLTNESKALVDAARTAYEALATDAQKALVSNYTTLTADEQKYSDLQVADVKAKIDAIGDIELTDESKAAIDTARAAFKALNADQQALVANAKVLDYAEKLYEALDAKDKADKDKAAAEKSAAEALDKATKAETDKAAAETEAAKALDNAAKAAEAQAKAEAEAAAAKAAQATAEKAAADAKTAQTKAEEDAATAKTAQATAEKAAADAKTAQTKAEEDAAAAKAAQAKAEEDAAAAKTAQATAEKNAEAANSKVSDLTEQLDAAVKQIEELEISGNVNEALKKQVAELKEQLDAAKTAQNEANEALAKAQDVAAAKIAAAEAAQEKAEEEATAAEKAQATAEQTAKEATEKAAAAEKAQATAEQNAKEATEKAAAAEEAQKVAEAAQAEAEKKAAEDKAAADQAAADKVIKLIDAIGNVEKTNTSENKIVAARAAYDALTDEQKALVTNYTVLTKAESAYKTLPQTGMSGFHKVFAGLAALMGITGMGLIKKSRKEDEEE